VKNVNTIANVAILSVTFSVQASASEFLNGHFSGEFGLNTGMMSVESNLNTESNQILEGDINRKGDSENMALLFPVGVIEYNFGKQQLFAGMSRDDIASGDFVMAFGYRNQIVEGTVLSLSYVPTLSAAEVWQDPYLTGTKRSVTDSESEGYRIQLTPSSGKGFSLDLGYGTNEVENELSGSSLSNEERSILRRSGDSRYLNVGYQFPLNSTMFLSPTVTYIDHNADGRAMSFQSYAASLGLINQFGHHALSVNVDYAESDYDAINPVFGLKQSDSSYGAFVAYEYASLFNVDYLSFISFAGMSQTNSNIDFFDASLLAFSVGLNLKF